MANNRLKEIKDYTEGLHFKHTIDSLRYAHIPLPFPDPIGPVKLDAFEGFLRSYLDLMPRVAQRIDSIETFLEKDLPQGKPYVRAEERPDVGAGAVSEVMEAVRLLDARISKLESARKA